MTFPNALHICAYDVRGTLTATGRPHPNRESGLVTRTHQLLSGLARRYPDTRLHLTKTGAITPGPAYGLRTPEGLTASVQDIATAFPQYLREDGRKSHRLVKHYYEDTLGHPGNPVWRSLAEQYARAIDQAGTSYVLAQSINPLIGLLHAQKFDLLAGPLRLTAVVNDSGPEFSKRFGYLAQQLRDGAELVLIAVSESVRQELIQAGVPGHAVRKVLNGMDAHAYRARLHQAEAEGTWERVRARNGVPAGCPIVLVSARRVLWKGHEDVIWAARHLAERGLLGETCFVFNGAGMLDSRALGYQRELENLIEELQLTKKVFLLDSLTPQEVASCYVGAHVAVLPSRKPEPFGYGRHSEVFRRPGSRWCIQVFTADCPELTVEKVRREYDYLLQAYAAMPALIPYQRLFTPGEDAHISQALLAKRWVQVDASLPLLHVRRDDLTRERRSELEQFIAITRSLLERAPQQETFLPDILDPRFTNLALDVEGGLRLLDTNRLINTDALRRLPAGRSWTYSGVAFMRSGCGG